MIFIDFWSLQLTWNGWHERRGARERVKIPWSPRLPEVLVRAVAADAVYAGTHVYASYAPGEGRDSGFRRFLNVMDGFPGYDVFVRERAAISPPSCPNAGCHRPIAVCPHCRRSVRRTVEKGIDTALVTDLIRCGIDDHYDLAVLVACDADHVPAVKFLGSRMKLVTHVWFRGQANELRNACWSHLLIDDLIPQLLGESGSAPADPPLRTLMARERR